MPLAKERHEFVDSGNLVTGAAGRIYKVCATCGGKRLGQRHFTTPDPLARRRENRARVRAQATQTSLPMGPPLPRPSLLRNMPDPPRLLPASVLDGPAPEPDHTPSAIPGAVPPGIASALNGLGQAIADALHAAQAQNVPTALPGGSWQFDLLAIAVDRVLAMPPGSVSHDLVGDLEALRRHLRPRVDVGATSNTNGALRANLTGTGQSGGGAVVHAAPPAGVGKARRIIRGIRSPEIRTIVDQARAMGWTIEARGSGHVRVVNPTDPTRSFVVSATSDGGGRGSENVAAVARRAGLAL
jgi:hypothetical protein